MPWYDMPLERLREYRTGTSEPAGLDAWWAERLELNDIGVVHLRLSEPLCVDPYEENRATGAFVLIDEATNETVGAGMVLSAES